jgi:hypothetical protein
MSHSFGMAVAGVGREAIGEDEEGRLEVASWARGPWLVGEPAVFVVATDGDAVEFVDIVVVDTDACPLAKESRLLALKESPSARGPQVVRDHWYLDFRRIAQGQFLFSFQ